MTVHRVKTQEIDLGKDGSKWQHGWIPLNAAAVAIKTKRGSGGGNVTAIHLHGEKGTATIKRNAEGGHDVQHMRTHPTTGTMKMQPRKSFKTEDEAIAHAHRAVGGATRLTVSKNGKIEDITPKTEPRMTARAGTEIITAEHRKQQSAALSTDILKAMHDAKEAHGDDTGHADTPIHTGPKGSGRITVIHEPSGGGHIKAGHNFYTKTMNAKGVITTKKHTNAGEAHDHLLHHMYGTVPFVPVGDAKPIGAPKDTEARQRVLKRLADKSITLRPVSDKQGETVAHRVDMMGRHIGTVDREPNGWSFTHRGSVKSSTKKHTTKEDAVAAMLTARARRGLD